MIPGRWSSAIRILRRRLDEAATEDGAWRLRSGGEFEHRRRFDDDGEAAQALVRELALLRARIVALLVRRLPTRMRGRG